MLRNKLGSRAVNRINIRRRHVLPAVVLAGASMIIFSIGAFGFPSVFPTGTTIYDPKNAYSSYVLFGAPDGKTHLIDMNGHEVHRWDKIGFPSEIINPAINGGKKGQLLVQLSHTDLPNYFGYMFANKSIGELDWDRRPNGNTIIIATADRIIPSLSPKSIADQVIYEITPKGDIVWKWYAGDHVDEFGFSPEGMKLLRASLANGDKSFGFLTINDMQPIGLNKWYDAGDKRFDPENIVIDSREASFVAIIDKKTGKIVWRMGPDYQITKGPDLRASFKLNVPRQIDMTSGQHDAHIIPEGLPGAGNLLLFDNESASGFPPTRIGTANGSRVLEINPVTKQIVWQYTATDSGGPLWIFDSSFISSARRLPNGNTLIDEGMNGRFFQVTSKGEIVWEYVNPYYGLQIMGEGHKVNTNWVFRAQPIPYDWVPDGTPHSEIPLAKIGITSFRVPGSP